jgi:2-keto-4-pentenoate hydratase/2-oxohepta-3-ene-1,7-dioic acid hydratase in catechol pathway
MKLIRYGPPGREKPGVLIKDDVRLDASDIARDFDGAFFAEGGIEALADWLESSSDSATRISPDVRLGPPIANPGKLVCIGLNYRDHARETGAKEPAEPVLFFKATSAIVGPNDDLMIPRDSTKTDWEVELAVVIGKRASHVPLDRAAEHVAGYVLHNDYSERAFQLERGGQWVKGKSCDTFAPLGPYLVTRDEIEDVQRLAMWLSVNGERMQSGTTADMIFGIDELVSYVSRFMTLHAGDVISTGTPAGVGLGMTPPRYLSPGDVVELGIDGLGSSRQLCTAFRPRS